jgi:hypothetical protein
MSAATLVTTTIAGRTFKCTRRTEAHLLWTIARLAVLHPQARLVIIQTCYNTGVSASAGTHDFDAVFDVQIVGLDWFTAQRFLRAHGWAAWVRQPPAFSFHIHMVSLGYVGKVGIFVPGQVADYYNHRSGLSGHVPDTTWHPDDIDSTIFDFEEWEREMEDVMRDEDWTKLEKVVQKAVAAELDKAVVIDSPTGGSVKRRSLRQMVKELWLKREA